MSSHEPLTRKARKELEAVFGPEGVEFFEDMFDYEPEEEASE